MKSGFFYAGTAIYIYIYTFIIYNIEVKTMWFMPILSGITGAIVGVLGALYVVKKYAPMELQRSIVEWLSDEDNQKAINSYMDVFIEKVKQVLTGSAGAMVQGVAKQVAGAGLGEGGQLLDFGNPVLNTIGSIFLSKFQQQNLNPLQTNNIQRKNVPKM